MNSDATLTWNPIEGTQGADSAPASPARRRALPVVLVVGVALVALLALAAGGLLISRSGRANLGDAQASTIATKQSDPRRATGDVDLSAVGSAAAAAGGATAPESTSGVKGGSGGGATNNGSPAPTPTAPAMPVPTPEPAPPAPVITSFTTPENIDCHNGNSQMFSASWTTTHAVKVTISIDGPGVYKTYPANGSDSLPFNCSSPHTFRLTAFGQDGKTVTKTITLQPRNVQVPTSGTDG